MFDSMCDFAQALRWMTEATTPGDLISGAAAGSYMRTNFPNHLYHADRDALSCSLLKPLLLSPAHFMAALVAPHKSSAAKDFGTLLHSVLLEPEKFNEEIAVYPGIGDERDCLFKAFCAQNTLRLVVDEPTFSKARHLAQKVCEQRYRGRPIGRFLEESQTEVSLYFDDPTTGLALRIRPDIYHPDITFDLKSTRRPCVRSFARDAVDLHYDLQAYMYALGRSQFEGSATAKPFVFLAAETSAPYSIQVQAAGETFMSNGALKYQECLSLYQACTTISHWPDLSGEGTLEIEYWQGFKRNDNWRSDGDQNPA